MKTLRLINGTPTLQEQKQSVNYIQNELVALEREQKQIDKQADILEKYLRKIMQSGKLVLSRRH